MEKIKMDALLSQMRELSNNMNSPSKINNEDKSSAKFNEILTKSLSAVSDLQNKADDNMQKFEVGDPNISLPEVMVSISKANIAFQTLIEVRNKMVSAYQEIMNLQV